MSTRWIRTRSPVAAMRLRSAFESLGGEFWWRVIVFYSPNSPDPMTRASHLKPLLKSAESNPLLWCIKAAASGRRPRARVEPVLCVLSCGYQGTGDSQVDHRRGILPKQIPVADVTPQDRHGLMPSLLGDRSLAGAGRGRRGRQTSAQAVAGEALAKPPVRLTGGRRPIRWRLPNWRHRRDRGPGPGTVAVLAGRPATLAVSYQAGAAIPCERSGL